MAETCIEGAQVPDAALTTCNHLQYERKLNFHLVKAPAQRVRNQLANPWVGKIPWRRAWQPTPVFLPGESHGQGKLVAAAHEVTQSQTRLSD